MAANDSLGSPVDGGTVTSVVGHRNAPDDGKDSNGNEIKGSTEHQGTDVKAKVANNNTEIKAMQRDAVVVYAGEMGGGAGKTVIAVDHFKCKDGKINERSVVYMYLKEIDVHEVQVLAQGDKVVVMGKEGTAEHLHAEVRVDDKLVERPVINGKEVAKNEKLPPTNGPSKDEGQLAKQNAPNLPHTDQQNGKSQQQAEVNQQHTGLPDQKKSLMAENHTDLPAPPPEIAALIEQHNRMPSNPNYAPPPGTGPSAPELSAVKGPVRS